MDIKSFFLKYKRSDFKLIINTTISSVCTLLFALYNYYLGIVYLSAWGLSIAIYYTFLVIARAIAIIVERKIKDKADKNISRRKTYVMLSIFMFVIDLSLVAPITLMVVNPVDVSFGIIPSLVVAVYTTYKITMAIINYTKIKCVDNLVYKLIRELSVVDALVSILTLQHILIMVNGGMTSSMMTLSACSSFAIFSVIIIFSITTLVNTIKNN